MPFFYASPHRVFAFAAGLAVGIWLVFVLSLPATAQAPSADPDDFIAGNYWALIIGIDKYPALDNDKQLTVARKDAEVVARLLTERYGFEKERLIELYDDKATRKGIIRAFSSLRRRTMDKDSLFIYYAGHGDYESSGKDRSGNAKRDGMGYWIPSDGELDDPATFIFNSQVRDYMADIPAKHVLAVVDSAYSGSLVVHKRPVPGGSYRELYHLKSRWMFTSGGLHPIPWRHGHSTFASNIIRNFSDNKKRYLLAGDLFSLPCNPMLLQLLPPCRGEMPRYSSVLGAGDEGGQFVFRLCLAGPCQSAQQPEMPQDALMQQQQEEFEKRKQEMLERLRKLEEQRRREAELEPK
jgi:hypothetical protein